MDGLGIIFGLIGMALYVVGFGDVNRGLLILFGLFLAFYVTVYVAHGVLLAARGLKWIWRRI